MLRAGVALVLVSALCIPTGASARIALSDALCIQYKKPRLSSLDRQKMAQLASRSKENPNRVAALFIMLHVSGKVTSLEAKAWSRLVERELRHQGVQAPAVQYGQGSGSPGDFGCVATSGALEVEVLFEERGSPANVQQRRGT